MNEEKTEEFNWDNPEEISFFDEVIEPSTETEDVIKAVEEGEKEEVQIEEKEVVEEMSFFEEDNTEEDLEVVEDDNIEEVEEISTPSIATLKYLQDNNLLDIEIEEGVEITEDTAQELLSDNFESALDKRLSETLGSLPEEVKDLVKFALKDGDINTYLKERGETRQNSLTTDIDITTEDNQILVVQETLKEEGYDDEYIKSQIDFLKDSKNLESFSKTKFNKWKGKAEAFAGEQLAKQKETIRVDKIRIKESKTAVKSYFTDNTEIGGLTISKKEAEEMPSYMHDKTYKLEGGRSITEMEKDLVDILNSPDKRMLLGKIIKSKFDFSSIASKSVTDNNKKINASLRNSGTVVPKGTRRKKKESKDLLTLLNN